MVLKLLVNQWHSLILEIKDGEVVLLPYDFADEYIGCFQVTCVRDQLNFTNIATKDVMGYSIYPSNILDFSRSNPKLVQVNPQFQYSVTFPKKQTLEELQSLTSRIEAQIKSAT